MKTDEASALGAVTPAKIEPSRASASTGNLFRYDALTGQYIFNWGTKGLTTGTYQLKVDLGDGATHIVTVSLK